ncbi:hypothetical protein SPLC1_S011970 [Arthrospira platensis C1]|nr:hypothetical protein SPLC1_S011970 [Arthrospira platensis C1]
MAGVSQLDHRGLTQLWIKRCTESARSSPDGVLA